MLKKALKRVSVINQTNAYLRSKQQERWAERGLAGYRAEAERKGIVCLEGEGLRRELRRRLRERRPGYAAKAKGDLHIFLAYYISNWEAVLPEALAPLGKVSAFEWRSCGFDDRKEDWLEHRDAMNRAMLEAFHKANQEAPVDAVVGYLSGNNTAPEVLQEMAESGAMIFNFCWDDKLRFPGKLRGGRYVSPAAIAHAVDLNLTNAPDSVIKYAMHGGLSMFWPEAAHPDWHKPYDVPFEFDVSFVGGRYGWRPHFIGKLIKRGITVKCFGPGWENGALSDEEMIKLYSRSRINLGFGGVAHSRKLMCLKGRDFEVPMSGGLYLTQDNPELSLVYEVGKEIETYRDEANCARIIRELLADPDRAAAIRRAGRQRCLRDHTYEARWAEVLRLSGLMKEYV